MLTQTLAAFAAARDPLPPAMVHEAKRAVLNGIAAAMGAVDAESVRILVEWARATAACGAGQVWGRTECFTPGAAALINAAMCHELDYDDTHPGTLIHPTAVVLPAALHPAEAAGLPGAAVVAAFVRGAEVALRLGVAVSPAHFNRGYHTTATAGAVGAAAAAGHVAGLGAGQMQHALGTAAAVCSGLREVFGSHGKPFQVGNACRSGVTAAELAARGLTSAPAALEGRYGWVNAGTGAWEPAALASLGETWLFAENTHKPFACGVVAQPAMDGVIRLREAHGLRPEQVAAMDLAVAPRALDICGNPRPRTGLEGKFSVCHGAAVVLVDGRGGVAQFTDARVQDPAVLALRERIKAVPDAALAEDAARVEVTLTDGRHLSVHVEHCAGSLAVPMTDGQLEEKFRACTEGRLAPAMTEKAIDLIWHLDRLMDVRRLGRVLAPAG